jgi:hypothetical protein
MADKGRDAADAMGDFTKRAPDILQNVLGQLKGTQDRMRDLGLRTHDIPAGLSANPFDLGGLDPHAPGAFSGITATPPPGRTPGPVGPSPVTDGPARPTRPSRPGFCPSGQAARPGPRGSSPNSTPGGPRRSERSGVNRDPPGPGPAVEAGLNDRRSRGTSCSWATRHREDHVARGLGHLPGLGPARQGQLVGSTAPELVAGYLGQTAIKTAEVAHKAKGGVLFIDEAYSLAGDQYGEEAINTLVKEMEDNRHDLVVIVAGYPRPMSKFIAENPGLASRFRTTIQFADYTDDELMGIFTGMADRADYDMSDDALTAFKVLLAQQVRDETFGNGRFARNTLEAAIGKHAWRLRDVEEPTLEQLRTVLPEDVSPTATTEPVEFGPAATAPTPAAPTAAPQLPDTGPEVPPTPEETTA